MGLVEISGAALNTALADYGVQGHHLLQGDIHNVVKVYKQCLNIVLFRYLMVKLEFFRFHINQGVSMETTVRHCRIHFVVTVLSSTCLNAQAAGMMLPNI